MRQKTSPFGLNGVWVRASPVARVSGFTPVFANDDLLALDDAKKTEIDFRHTSNAKESPLKACDGEPWGTHFHAWRGRSEKRYVCSVFPFKAHEPQCGLPEFSQAIGLAVAFGQNKKRICRNLFPFSWAGGLYLGSGRPFERALESGVREWHVHLLAQTISERQAVLNDLGYVQENCADFLALA